MAAFAYTAKPTFAAYEAQASNPLNVINDIGTWISPATEVMNLLGIKNPTPGIAEGYINSTYDIGDHYANKVKFGGWLGTIGEGYSTADATRIYNSMAVIDLNTVGQMADKDMRTWTDARLKALNNGTFQGVIDPGGGEPTTLVPQGASTVTTSSAGEVLYFGLTESNWLLVAGVALLLLAI